MNRLLAIALGAALLTAACSGISTTVDFNPDVDFSAFSTYMWLDSEGEIDDLTKNRVRSAVDAAMQSRGFSKADDDDADLAVSYQVTTADRRSFTTIDSGWGRGYRWGGWGASVGRTVENTWTEGTLILALFETGDKNLVWTGSASSDLNPSNSPQQRQERISKAVERMMRDFPPGQ